MCASSPTDQRLEDLAYKVGKKVGKGVKTVQIKLPRTGQELDEVMQDLLAKIPVADAMVCTAGFFAGWNGMTPMTMLMGGLKGFGEANKAITTVAGAVAFDPLHIVQKVAAEVAEDKKASEILRWKLTMACIGLIEAYMITRPGALAAIAQIGSTMTQAGIDIFKELWPL